ncbi:MAG: LytTR family transcriptional regulator DNA-binding domain-containing protein, partial [Clostridia bacterium]|nr:LytTR family transcriptional regulator DNA-binding domain-containing protein [Clostridia bacterium]
LDKVVKSISNRKDKSIIVKTKDGSIKISYDNIVYAELVKRNVVYHLGNSTKAESISVRTSFTDTVKELSSDNRFIFAGKSMLLNMHHILGVRNETISFDNGEEITIGRKLCKEVHNTWLDFSISEVNGI